MEITNNTINNNLINKINSEKKEYKKPSKKKIKDLGNTAHSIEISRLNVLSSKTELKNVEQAAKLAEKIKNEAIQNDNAIDIQGKNLDWKRVADLLKE